MIAKRRTSSKARVARWYRGADIPMRVIRRFARQVAERYQPEKIILFGSYAYGTPHEDSDVDILVIMPARNQRSKAGRIRWEVPAPFAMDLIVRTPETCAGGCRRETRSFERSCRRARSSMKKLTREWVRKAEADYRVAVKVGRGAEPLHDAVCFHCQQSAEKYLKGLMEELGLSVRKTHDLDLLRTALQ